jgi:hypothetical protein
MIVGQTHRRTANGISQLIGMREQELDLRQLARNVVGSDSSECPALS